METQEGSFVSEKEENKKRAMDREGKRKDYIEENKKKVLEGRRKGIFPLF